MQVHAFPQGDITTKYGRIFFKNSSTPEPLSQFPQSFGQIIVGFGEIKFVEMKGSAFSEGEILPKCENILTNSMNSKILFSRTIKPISTKAESFLGLREFNSNTDFAILTDRR